MLIAMLLPVALQVAAPTLKMPPTPEESAAALRSIARCALPTGLELPALLAGLRDARKEDLAAAAMRRDAIRFPITGCKQGNMQ